MKIINDHITCEIFLKSLGFIKKSEEEARKIGSLFIMKKDGFEVEYSTNGLWENENKNQTSIIDFTDLNCRYYKKTGKILNKNL